MWWYLISELLMLLFSLIGIVSAVIFVAIVCRYRSCRTLTILLVANTAFAGFLSSMTTASQALYMLVDNENGPDALCYIRGYLIFAGAGLIYHSTLLQALHRLVVNVFAHPLRPQSQFIFAPLVAVQWLVSLTFVLPLLLNGQILSSSRQAICSLSFMDWRGTVYVAVGIYVVPLCLLFLIYWIIIRHIRRTTLAGRRNLAARQRLHKEKRTLIRIAIPVLILLVLGWPYIGFFLYAQVTDSTPLFSYHVGITLLTLGQGAAMVTGLILTENVSKHLIVLVRQKNRVQPFVIFVVGQRRF